MVLMYSVMWLALLSGNDRRNHKLNQATCKLIIIIFAPEQFMTEHAQYTDLTIYMIAFQVAHRHNECSYNTIILVYIYSLTLHR